MAAAVATPILSDGVIEGRLKVIYRLMKQDAHKRALMAVIGLLRELRSSPSVHMTRQRYNQVLDNLFRMRVELALGHYSCVHNRVRDLHISGLVSKMESPAPKGCWM